MQGIHFLFVAIGGAGGAVLRYAVQLWVLRWSALPPLLATAFANLSGAFLLGLCWGMAARCPFSPSVRLLVMTGFCGGYTTFSTFTAEVFTLLQQGSYLAASAYLFVSLFGCLFSFGAGYGFAKLSFFN